jgi:hypothetical protein
MGDLWIITPSKRTAAWARTACNLTGPGGTELRIKPIVLLLGAEEVDALLDAGRPSLAFFAAWAMRGRHGPAAARIVERAFEITDRLPRKALRRQQGNDILRVLDRRQMDKLKVAGRICEQLPVVELRIAA